MFGKLNMGFDQKTIEEFNLGKKDFVRGVYHKFNHLEKNVLQARNFKHLQQNNVNFQRSAQNKQNRQNLELIKHKHYLTEFLHRTTSIDKMNKWSRFRSTRAVVIDKYCLVLKRSKALNTFLKHFCLHKIVVALNTNWKTNRALNERKLIISFICIKIKHMWRKIIKTRGRDITEILTKKIRMSFTLATVLNERKNKKAKLIVKDVLLRVLYIELLILRQDNWRSSFIFI